jgi:type IV pilus assembly protein PilM
MLKLNRTSQRSRTIVGLEIEPGRVAAAEVTVNGAVQLERAANIELPVGAVRDGEVIDVETVSAALRTLWSDNKNLGRNVRIGVANAKIVVRTIDVPPLTDAKMLDAAVRFVASQELPMPMDAAVLDWQSLGVVDTPEGQRHRVLLVAARREMVESVLAAVNGAGLKAQGIDLSAFAMVRVLGAGETEPALYLSIGGLTNLAVVIDGVVVFTRVAGSGMEGLAIELAERRVLTLDHARLWLRHVGLEQPLEEVEGDPDIVADARAILIDGTRRLAADVRASLDFHHSQMTVGAPVARVILTGAAVAVPGFVAALQNELGLPVEVRTVAAGTGLGDEADRAAATVAAGLAVERVAA